MKTYLGVVAGIGMLCCATLAHAEDSAEIRFTGYIAERSAEDWRGVADALVGNGKRDTAATAYERLLELAPGDTEALTFLADYAEANGDADKAATYRAELGETPSGE